MSASSTSSDSLIDRVSALILEVSASEILPRFQALRHDDIREKKPGDPVTIADEAAEEALIAGLGRLLPGSLFVGEEAVHHDPSLMDALASTEDDVWVIDPIDGTINFAAGLPLFAVMIALLRNGEPAAAWVYDPVHEVMATAERGGGTWLDGERVSLSPPAELRRLSGCLHLPRENPDMAAALGRNFAKVGPVLVLHCAGLEYQTMLMNRLHFSIYHGTNPWDQLPGLLLLSEAGGKAAHIDDSAYVAAAPKRSPPLLAAASDAVWCELRDALFGGMG